MIPQNLNEVEQPRWQKILADGVETVDELLNLLEIERSSLSISLKASHSFPLRVPRGFIKRMKKGDPNDPLLRQVLPLADEEVRNENYSTDPLGELVKNPIPGLLHKYESRVLLTLTGVCAINCRYCFRRHFPYRENHIDKHNWEKIFDYIQSHPLVTEVILSGGEPLLLNDKQLHARLELLSQIPSLKTVRFHTRMPIVLPERITDSFVESLTKTRLKPVMVLHCNHAQEIDEPVANAALLLKKVERLIVLNQAVLLKGVNDNEQTLIDLSYRLFDLGILPYYLHYPDKVHGTQHFTPKLSEAKKLMQRVSEKLPGFLVPKFVYESRGAKSKVLISYPLAK